MSRGTVEHPSPRLHLDKDKLEHSCITCTWPSFDPWNGSKFSKVFHCC